MNIIIFNILLTGIFILNLELDPKMGNIWWRNNKFQPRSILNLMIYPFKNIYMWKYNLWSINYWIWIIFGNLIYINLKY